MFEHMERPQIAQIHRKLETIVHCDTTRALRWLLCVGDQILASRRLHWFRHTTKHNGVCVVLSLFALPSRPQGVLCFNEHSPRVAFNKTVAAHGKTPLSGDVQIGQSWNKNQSWIASYGCLLRDDFLLLKTKSSWLFGGRRFWRLRTFGSSTYQISYSEYILSFPSRIVHTALIVGQNVPSTSLLCSPLVFGAT